MQKRGSGQTTRKMQSAPYGAIYIWCNSGLEYPRALARHIGRQDLIIRSPAYFENFGYRGLRIPVVLDHATMENMSPIQREGWRDCMNELALIDVTQIGRLAMRVEGDNWVAYYAMPGTMNDAVNLGSIKMGIAENPARKENFLSLMRDAVADIIEQQTGTRPIFTQPNPAPEHERAGRS